MELAGVGIQTTQDALVTTAPDGPITGLAVSSSDNKILADGKPDPSGGLRCVSTGTEGSAVLTITAQASDGTLLTDHCTVTVSKVAIATQLNSVVTGVAK